MRFKHSRMHRDNRAPGISKPSRGPGPSPNPLKNLKSLLPNRKRKTQRKLRPDPQLRTLRLRPIMILSSQGASAGSKAERGASAGSKAGARVSACSFLAGSNRLCCFVACIAFQSIDLATHSRRRSLILDVSLGCAESNLLRFFPLQKRDPFPPL